MSDRQFVYYMIVNTLVAVGTLGSAFVALFGSILRAKLWPPKFEARVLKPEGERTTFTNNQTGQYVDDVRFYHLRVENKRPWSKATNVGLHLVRIEETGPDGQLQIKWDNDVPIRCRHQEFYPLEQEIGTYIDYDLCSINKTDPTLRLMPIIPANNLTIVRHGECKFVASFQVKSSQCESAPIRIQMFWDGAWDTGNAEMQMHFKPKILPGSDSLS